MHTKRACSAYKRHRQRQSWVGWWRGDITRAIERERQKGRKRGWGRNRDRAKRSHQPRRGVPAPPSPPASPVVCTVAPFRQGDSAPWRTGGPYTRPRSTRPPGTRASLRLSLCHPSARHTRLPAFVSPSPVRPAHAPPCVCLSVTRPPGTRASLRLPLRLCVSLRLSLPRCLVPLSLLLCL